MKTALDNEAAVIAGVARALATNADYDSLVGMAGEAQCVLIGEASHGTHEFYAIRAALTRRLIEKKDFVPLLWKQIGQTVFAFTASSAAAVMTPAPVRPSAIFAVFLH